MKTGFTLLLFVHFCSPMVFAETGCSGKTVLFFGNGMLNAYDDARQSYDELQKGVEKALNNNARLFPTLDNPLSPNIAFNSNKFFLLQLFQVLSQGYADHIGFFFKYLSELESAPEWFRDLIKKTLNEMKTVIVGN